MNPVSSAVGNAPVVVTNMNLELLKAATSGKIKRLEAVFREDIDISIQTTPIHDTAIHIAAGLGHLEIIQRIHKRCPMLFTKANDMGDTSLHRAARVGHFEVLRFLIECSKTSPSTDIENGLTNILRKGNIDGDTILHESVSSSELKMVKLVIAEDPQLLCIDNNVGESPLHIAVEKGNIKIIKEILKRGPYSCNGPRGRTSLHAAIIHKRRDITKLLLDKNPELLNKADNNKRTPLHFASGLGLSSDMCMLMRRNSSNPCLLDNDGFAPIHMSARFGELDIVKKFIKLRPDLKDFLDAKRRNILHIAVQSQQVGVVKYILQSKELNDLVNAKDEEGNTPLHQAAITENSYIINLLVRHKRLKVMALNDKQQTALDIARSQMEETKEANEDKSLVLATLLYASSPPWSNHNTLKNEIIQLGKRGSKESLQSYKDKGNILLLVATLVATVTYAAGFSPPGGYESEGPTPNDVYETGGPYRGEAILKDYRGFHIYLSSATVAMILSLGAILLLIWLQFMKSLCLAHRLLHVGKILIVLSITSMVVAFINAWILTLTGLTAYAYISKFDYTAVFLILVFAIAVIAALGALFRLYRIYRILGHRRSIYLRSWIHERMRKHENHVSTLFHYSQ